MKPETWVAIYAAIVGTSAFLLNLKTWFDSGVKLKLELISEGMIIGGDPQFDEKDVIMLTVINRGDASTMVTNMVVFKASWWRLLLFKITSSISWWRWKVSPEKSYIVPNPQLKGSHPIVPFDLAPSKRWTGILRQRPDIIADLHTGNYYTGIFTSNRDRPYLVRIPKRKNPLPENIQPLDIND